MNKKSFFISLGFHLFLGVIVILLIFFVKKSQKEVYIPVYLKNFYPNTKLLATSQKIDNNIKKVHHVHEIKHIHKIIEYKIIKQKVSNEKSIIKTIPKPIKKHINIKKQRNTKNIHAILKKTQKISKKHQMLNTKDIQQQQMIERQYFNYIYKLISKYKTYPFIARKLEQTGTVRLKFIILKNGYISNIIINKSSNFTALDKAAKKILLKIKYFRPIPTTLNKDQLQIIIPISYRLD